MQAGLVVDEERVCVVVAFEVDAVAEILEGVSSSLVVEAEVEVLSLEIYAVVVSVSLVRDALMVSRELSLDMRDS